MLPSLLSVDVSFFDRFLDTDIAVFEWVQKIQQSAVEPVVTFILKNLTNLGKGGIMFIILGFILLFTKKYKKTGAGLLVTLLVMILLNDLVLKNIFSRPRPFNLYEDSILNTVREQYSWWAQRYIYPNIVSQPDSFSFPSGHASSAFCVAFAGTFVSKKARVGVPLFIIAFLMAFSRVYLEVHYFSDVAGGALVGLIYGIIGALIISLIWKKFGDKAEKGIEKIKAVVLRRKSHQ